MDFGFEMTFWVVAMLGTFVGSILASQRTSHSALSEARQITGALNQRVDVSIKEVSDLRTEVSTLSAEIQFLKGERSALKETNTSLTATVADNNRTIGRLQAEKESALHRVKELTRLLEDKEHLHQKDRDAWQEEKSRLEALVVERDATIAALTAQLEAAKASTPPAGETPVNERAATEPPPASTTPEASDTATETPSDTSGGESAQDTNAAGEAAPSSSEGN